MKKYIVYLILCFVSCLIFSCTSVYENGDTSCIPEGMERLTFKVIVPSSKVVGSNTRSTALEKENEIKDLFVKIEISILRGMEQYILIPMFMRIVYIGQVLKCLLVHLEMEIIFMCGQIKNIRLMSLQRRN